MKITHTLSLVFATIISTGLRSSAAITPMPLISLNVPAYSSSVYPDGNSMAAQANKFTNNQWRSLGQPAWLAYDLSGVAADRRSKILVAWYSGGYDKSILAGNTYNFPGPYVIEGNMANGGSLPTSGWVIIVQSADPNVYGSFHHIINNFAGYKWLRFRTLADNPWNDAGNHDLSLKMDVYDISNSDITDSWIICGNSITAMTWNANEFGIGVHAKNANYYPAFIGAGIGYMKSSDGAQTLIPKWIPGFPGKYVILCYGTNDPAGTSEFYGYYETMVKAIIAAGKIPIIGTIIWSKDPSRNVNYEANNTKLAELKAAYPQILNGPDLYNKFKNHTEWYQDDLHPNAIGRDTLRQTWINWALKNIYSGTVGINLINSDKPSNSLLNQNYPNPFNSKTVIKYTIPVKGYTSLKIYDFLGRELITLVSEVKPAGEYTVQWDGINAGGQRVENGLYFYQLKFENYTEVKKCLVLK